MQPACNWPKMNISMLMFMGFMAYRNFGIMGIVGLPAMFMAMLYFRQNNMLYIPTKGAYRVIPSQFGMNIYEKASILCADGVRISAWLIKQAEPRSAPTIIMFHGNAGTIQERLPNASGLVEACACNLLMVDYRGYGPSEGDPTEPGLRLDAKAALDWALKHEDIDEDNIFVFGRSLGGAVAVRLVHDNPTLVRGLIIENTFCGIREMASALFPFLQLLPASALESLLVNHWRSEECIGALRMPVLMLAGQLDEIVPTRQMDSMWYQLSCDGNQSPLSEIVRFESGKHNETWVLPDYYTHWKRWMAAAAKPNSKKREEEGVCEEGAGDTSPLGTVTMPTVDTSSWSNTAIR